MCLRHLFVQFVAEPGAGGRDDVAVLPADGFLEDLGVNAAPGLDALLDQKAAAADVDLDVGRALDCYPDLGVIGGLRKEAMYEGKGAIDVEMEKARRWIKKGRYIPGPDHFVLDGADFVHYRYFMESLRDVVMTTKPYS